MIKRLIFAIFIICGSVSAFAQYPNAPNKLRLGAQTTGDGLVFRTNAIPNWTPSSINNAWLAIDTLTGNAYSYQGGEWRLEVAGDLRQVYPKVINKSGVNIKRGQAVMVDYTQIIQGDLIRIVPADGSGAYSTKLTMGIASTDIANNAEGYITWFGYVREVKQADIVETGDTVSIGDILYLSPTQSGRLTNIEPTAPANKVTMALVVRKPNANNITLLVRPSLNEDLGELNDVDLTGLLDGQTIVWDSINSKWVAGNVGSVIDTTLIATRSYVDGKVDSTRLVQDSILVYYIGGSEVRRDTIAIPAAGVTGSGVSGRITYWNGTTSIAGNYVSRIDSAISLVSIGMAAASVTGAYNNFIGSESGNATTTGANNNFFGFRAGRVNTTGSNNVFFGNNAGAANTTGGNNNFFGFFSGATNTSGGSNNFFGAESGRGTTTGQDNNFYGRNAGRNNLSGNNNNFHGLNAGYGAGLQGTLTGQNNTIIGSFSGTNITGAAQGNLVIGNSVDLPTATANNQVVIKNVIFGTGASGTGTNVATGARVGINQPAPAVIFDIAGTDAIRIPVGTTIQRPGTPAAGMTRYNTSNGALEYYGAAAWEVPLKATNANGLGVSGRIFFGDANGRAETDNELFYNPSSNLLGIGTFTPARTLHVTGEVRITDLTTDPPTRIVGADADGDLGAITIGSGLSLSGDTLTASGSGTNLTFSGSSSPITLNSDTGTDVRFRSGNGITLTAAGDSMTIATPTPQLANIHISGGSTTVGQSESERVDFENPGGITGYATSEFVADSSSITYIGTDTIMVEVFGVAHFLPSANATINFGVANTANGYPISVTATGGRLLAGVPLSITTQTAFVQIVPNTKLELVIENTSAVSLTVVTAGASLTVKKIN